ncbi:hypothetical protein HanPSC8_Chr04g0185531 [Helianthus annuus]|nr:hypothetical protein HanPSC8_Chr04g0185531 [Helianthus annuus]
MGNITREVKTLGYLWIKHRSKIESFDWDRRYSFNFSKSIYVILAWASSWPFGCMYNGFLIYTS